MASMASCSLLDRLVWVSKDKAVEKYLLRPVYAGDFCRQLHAIFVWDFPHKVGGSDIFLFISFFIYLSTDRSARHVVSSLGVST